MIDPAFEILNQRGTPMFFSDVFANRPTAGIVGRIFISTDTYAFYRDTGTGWDLIGGPGTGTITGSGTIGTLPIWNGTQVIGDSSLLEGATKLSTTKDFQADRYYLTGMNQQSGALYWTNDRVTLANYNTNGSVEIEAGNGQAAQTISGIDQSTTFYGNIIRNGGLSTQFLKADGSLDSSTYITTNIYNGNGTLSGNRVVSLNSNYLSFAGGQTYIGSQTASSGLLTINNANADAHLQVVGANSPSIRIDNAGFGATQRLVFGLSTATNNFIQGATAGDICISTASYNPLLFGMWQTINASEVMRITTATNFLVGGVIDGGQKFQVTGNSYFNGDVGIGVSPTQRLSVRRSTNDGIIALLHQSTGYGLTIGSSETSAYISSGYLQTFVLKTDAGSGQVDRITLNSAGILGIGTNNLSNFRVFVNGHHVSTTDTAPTDGTGDIYRSGIGWVSTAQPTNVLSALITANNVSNYGADIYFLNRGGSGGNLINRFIITSGGDLNINMPNGTNRYLSWYSANGLYQVASISSFSDPSFNDAGYLVFSTAKTSSAGFTEKMRITPNGYIGINSISPKTILQSTGAAQTTSPSLGSATGGALYLTSTDPDYGMLFGISGTGTGWIQQQRTDGSATPYPLSLQPSGSNVLIGTTTNSGEKLYLNGSLRIDGQRSGTAGGSSGQHLIINCDGTTYKIALLNN